MYRGVLKARRHDTVRTIFTDVCLNSDECAEALEEEFRKHIDAGWRIRDAYVFGWYYSTEEGNRCEVKATYIKENGGTEEKVFPPCDYRGFLSDLEYVFETDDRVYSIVLRGVA